MVRLRVDGFFSACTGVRTHGAQAESQLRHNRASRKGKFSGCEGPYCAGGHKFQAQSSRKAPIAKRPMATHTGASARGRQSAAGWLSRAWCLKLEAFFEL